MQQDILKCLADGYWDWIAAWPAPLRMLILRWGCLLALLLIFGLIVRYLRPQWGVHSLGAQTTAALLAILIVLALPLSGPMAASKGSQNTFLTLALAAWLCLPYFVPRFLIRRQGLQRMTWPALYGLQLLLLIIQVVVVARS